MLKQLLPKRTACHNPHGYKLIENWQETKLDVCTGFKDSSISCYANSDFGVFPKVFCTASNAIIDLPAAEYFCWPYLPLQKKPIAPGSNELCEFEYDRTTRNRKTLTVDCKLNAYNLLSEDTWYLSTGTFMKHINQVDKLDCVRYVNHTVFWMYRFNSINYFHGFEDIFNTYESLLVLDNVNLQDAELVIYDVNPLFTYIQILEKMFGKGVRILKDNPFPRGTCFKRSIFNVWGFASTLGYSVIK